MAVARSGNQMSGTSGTPTHCVGLNARRAHNSSGFRYSPQLKSSGRYPQRRVAVLYFVVGRPRFEAIRSRVFIALAGPACRFHF